MPRLPEHSTPAPPPPPEPPRDVLREEWQRQLDALLLAAGVTAYCPDA